METQQSKINPVSPNTPHTPANQPRTDSGRFLGGIVIVTVGGILLARQLGVFIPYWLFSWPMALIGLGLYIGARHSFRNPGWIVPVLIGTVFLIDRFYYDFDLMHYFWPVFIIGIGLFMILRSRGKGGAFYNSRWNQENILEGRENVLDCVTVFGGVKKNIISKDFKGGEAVTIFGGTELNLTQADSTDKIVLELVQVFGGTKLIVPPHWKIHTEEMVTIFGGLNDKRPIPGQATADDSKVLILKGTCIFGGIDIKSY
jgi:predicted membrane protein